MMATDFLEIFKQIKDVRQERKSTYPLDEILLLCVCAVISGAEGWSGIAQFGKAKLDWFKRFLPYENGIPNEDTISWVMNRLNVKNFESCFVEWVNELASDQAGEIIAIDGKTARRSYKSKTSKKPLHMVSAWACKQKLSLGQVATAEKSNEITAIPVLLDMLNTKGALITIDAMGCQKEIAEKIKAKNADYVLALKGNHGLLFEAVKDYFAVAQDNNYAGVSMQQKTTLDSGHGRIETRTYFLIDDLNTLPKPELWSGLKSIGMVVSKREDKNSGKVSEQRRYYLNSITDVELFANAVRSHWGVENRLHWVLDVVFREDDSRIRKGDCPAVFNILRQLANNMLRRMDSKLSIKARRFQAALDDDFRTNVVFQ